MDQTLPRALSGDAMLLNAPTNYVGGSYALDCQVFLEDLGELLERITKDVDVESSEDLKMLEHKYKMGIHLGLWDIDETR